MNWKSISGRGLKLIICLSVLILIYSLLSKPCSLPYVGSPDWYIAIFAAVMSLATYRYTYYKDLEDKIEKEEDKKYQLKVEKEQEILKKKLNSIQNLSSRALIAPYLALDLNSSKIIKTNTFDNDTIKCQICLKNIGLNSATSIQLVQTSDREDLYSFINTTYDFNELVSPMSQTFAMPNKNISFDININISRLLSKLYNPTYSSYNSKELKARLDFIVEYTDIVGRRYLQLCRCGYCLEFNKFNYQGFKRGSFWSEEYSFPPIEVDNADNREKQIKNLLTKYNDNYNLNNKITH